MDCHKDRQTEPTAFCTSSSSLLANLLANGPEWPHFEGKDFLVPKRFCRFWFD